MKNSKILLGVCGGISIYKVCELIRLLHKDNIKSSVILTKGAKKFVKPLLFQALTENRTYSDLFTKSNPFNIPIHIGLAQSHDLLVVIPATANIIAQIYAGISDSLLTATILAWTKPILIVPAMNVDMYKNKITQRNIQGLKNVGYNFLEPDTGDLICKTTGEGHIPDVIKIKEFIYKFI